MFPKVILENYAKFRLDEPEKSLFEAAIPTMQLEMRGSLMEVVTPQEIERAGFAHLIDDIQKRAYRLIPIDKMVAFNEMLYDLRQSVTH